MKKSIVIIAFLCCSSSLVAQETGENTFGSWALYFGTNKVSEKFSIHTELELNHYELFNNFNQFWLLLGLNYDLSENSSVTVGYGYFNTDPTFVEFTIEPRTTENRAFEQFTTSQKLGKLNLQHRYRLEQRFINTPSEAITGHRFRYRLQLTHPISAKWFINVFDELFINFQQPTFDQNRLFLGIGHKLSENISVQSGYLKLHLQSLHYDRLQLVLTINTDLRKKQSKISKS